MLIYNPNYLPYSAEDATYEMGLDDVNASPSAFSDRLPQGRLPIDRLVEEITDQ